MTWLELTSFEFANRPNSRTNLGRSFLELKLSLDQLPQNGGNPRGDVLVTFGAF